MTRLVLSFLVVASLMGQNPCDLNGDGSVTPDDVTVAKNMALGAPACTATILGTVLCNIAMVQRVINAARAGGTCMTGNTGSHGLTHLTWVASTSTGVAGYNIYRGSLTGGPYSLLNETAPVNAVDFFDTTAQNGTTVYYVVKAVGTDNSLSEYSNEAEAVMRSTPSGPLEGLLTVSAVNATKGTTAVVPIILTNDVDRPAGGVLFTLSLPLWAANKATVTAGPTATGKMVDCKWQKATLTAAILRCLISGNDTDEILNGIVATLNIPIPATLVGTFTVPVSGQGGATSAGDNIALTGQSGRVTSSSLAENKKKSPMEARLTAEEPARRVVTHHGVDAPNVTFQERPKLLPPEIESLIESLVCRKVGSRGVECSLVLNSALSDFSEVNVSSIPENFVRPRKFLIGPGKRCNQFFLHLPPEILATNETVMLQFELNGRSVISEPIIW